MNPTEKGYNGNLLLKRQRTQLNWTQSQLEEFIKCKDDPIYFAQQYIKITHVDHGLIPIDLYDYQKDIIDSTKNHRNTIVLTGRQQGKTTTAVCLILHYVLFNNHKLVALLANKGDAAREILSRIQLAYEHLPKWLQQGVVEWNKGSVELENGCKILASSTSGSAIRGKSCVSGETLVQVRNKSTGIIKEIQIKDLTNRYKLFDGNEFRDFDGLLVQDKETYKLTTDRGYNIRATTDHRFMLQDGSWKPLELLVEGDCLLGVGIVSSIDYNGMEEVYDPINVAESSQYWSNGFISHNCSFLYIDEVAFVNNWTDFYTSVYPTLSSGKETKMLFTSTPNSLNHFYEFWKGATTNTNNFNPIKATWEKVPGRDDEWKQATLESMNFDMSKFAQEFEGEFIGSSGTLLSGSTLKSLQSLAPISVKDGLKVYTEASKDRTYTMNCDVSHGKGLDYSTITIHDVTELPYNQVCTFRSNTILPEDFAETINTLGRYYNQAYCLIENNDIGAVVTRNLWFDFEYENILSSEGAGRLGKKLSLGIGKKTDIGIRMTSSVKKLGCSILKLIVEQGQLALCDADTIGELSTFSKNGSSYEAEATRHDDCVMPLVAFAWMTTTEFFKEISGKAAAKVSDYEENQLANNLLSIGVYYNGNDGGSELVKFEGDDSWWRACDYKIGL
jgi:hypothetical protein